MSPDIPKKIYEKVYIGDGAYAHFDGYYIWLTTENGLTRTNQVALKPEVLRAFEAYIRDLRSLMTTTIQTPKDNEVCAACGKTYGRHYGDACRADGSGGFRATKKTFKTEQSKIGQ